MRLPAFIRSAVLACLLGCLPLGTVPAAEKQVFYDPEAAAFAYVKALLNSDHEAAYGLLTEADRAAASLEEWSGKQLRPLLPSRWNVELQRVDTHGATADIELEVTYPELEQLLSRLRLFASMPLTGDSLEAILGGYLENTLPTVSDVWPIKLTFTEDTGWLISADVATAKARNLRTSVYRADTKEEKISVWSEIVKLSPNDAKAATKLERLVGEVEYLDKVHITNLRVGVGKSYRGEEKAVFGTVVNKGDKTLDKVQVTVYFLDEQGRPMYEERYHAVLVSSYSSDNGPLRPNYRESFGYSARDVPDGWSGDVDAKVTNLEFSKNQTIPHHGHPFVSSTSKEHLSAIQNALKERSLYDGVVDGLWGPMTRDAIKLFQAKEGLSVTGDADPETVERLIAP